MKLKKSIGIIGFGNMGSGLATRLKRHYRVLVFDQDCKKTKALRGVKKALSIEELLLDANQIIIAVKPQNFPSLLKKIKGNFDNKLFISIAAGISTQYIEKTLARVRVIRVMPNLPSKIGKGMSCLARGRFAKAVDLSLAKKIFKHLGQILVLNEKMIDAATAVSGSGPGYVYAFLESNCFSGRKVPAVLIRDFKLDFKKAARAVGFTKSQADLLVDATVSGSLAVLSHSRLSISQLRKQITSKGGTTEKALKVLKRGGSLTDAVGAALLRAKQLSKKR
ncbi:MAG: pyrroline-5-carboxylate reductase [Candidatus Omnitrophica bacterium]|nr:pyrroline-5-carboxylate reductase [Candidatus Omnitrophota bacterium]